MNENEKNILENEEAIEVIENLEDGSGKTLVIAGGVAAALLVGGLAYKFVIGPWLAKRKAAKESEGVIEIKSEDVKVYDREDEE